MDKFTRGIESLQELKVDGGLIGSVEPVASPTWLGPDGTLHENLPRRAIVRVELHPAEGSNIQVELWLPEVEKWNGRLLGLGNGGAAGQINPGMFVLRILKGYAVVATDMGTAPNSDSGVNNREVWKDFGYRATHLMTVVAKQAIAAYYGRAPAYSYFEGGSTGGQQALQEAQRYPEDYDGIVAHMPAHCRTPLHAYFLWNYQILSQCPFTPAQHDQVVAATLEYMRNREIPLTAGKMVSDPRCEEKEIEGVIELCRRKDSTLTIEHAEALRKLFAGPRHAITGERIFGGVPLGSAFNATGDYFYLFRWVFGPDRKPDEINFGQDFETYTAELGPYLNAENPDLSRFAQRGGKLLMTSGSADPIVPYHATLDYYERVIECFGSIERVKEFFQYYIVPGMQHAGGAGINWSPGQVEKIRAWREEGIEPGQLDWEYRRDGQTEAALPVYPYPCRTGWDSETTTFQAILGARGGVDRVAERFLPAAEE